MENITLFGQIGLALADALKSKNGPLYMGIVTIGTLVLGWKFLDERYLYQNGDICLEPTDTNSIVFEPSVVSGVVPAEVSHTSADKQ